MSWRDDPAFGAQVPEVLAAEPDVVAAVPDWEKRARHLVFSLRHWSEAKAKFSRKEDRTQLESMLREFERAMDSTQGEAWAARHGQEVIVQASRCGIAVSGPEDEMHGRELADKAREILETVNETK